MWRLLITSFLFLLSLLVLFRAPTKLLWLISVVVTEFPYIFIATSLLFFVSCFFTEKYKIPILLISSVSIFLYILPIVQAYKRGINLEEDISKNFPNTKNDHELEKPFSVFKMFSGVGIKKVVPQILPYKILPERILNIDFYSSQTKIKSACVVVIHGGSWSQGDSKQLPDLNSYLANRDYAVAAINYRLAPTYKSPAPVKDVKDVLKYLTNNAEKLNIDTNNFILLGRSAGAQIALCAAYSLHNTNIKGVISFYGPADMVWGARIKGNPLVLNTDKVFDDYLGGSIDEVPQKFHESSAMDYVTKNSVPTLIIHGEHDPMVAFGHSVHLNNKLAENNVAHYFLNLPWATHGCDYNINGPSGQLTTFAVERFLNSVTKK